MLAPILTFAQGKLYPTGAARRTHWTLEATATAFLMRRLGDGVRRAVRPADKQMPEWVEGQWQRIDRRLARIEPPLGSPAPVRWIWQIAVGCAYGIP